MKKNILRYLLLGIMAAGTITPSLAQHYPYRMKIPFRDGNAWGYCDTLGQLIHPARYDSLGFFEAMQPVAICKQNGKYGLVDSSFAAALPPQYEGLRILHHSPPTYPEILQVTSGGKTGLITLKGEPLIAVQYDSIWFIGSFIIVRNNARYGVFSNDFQPLADTQYEDYYTYADDDSPCLLVLQKGGTYSKLSADGRLTPLDASRLPRRDSGFGALFGSGSNQGGVTCLSKEEVQKRVYRGEINLWPATILYDRLVDNNERGCYYRLLIREAQGYALFDLQRQARINRYYEDIVKVLRFSGDRELWCVQNNGKYAVIDASGATVLPYAFDGFGDIKRTHIVTKKAALEGVFIPFTNYPPIPCAYESVSLAKRMRVAKSWWFAIFAVRKSGKPGFVGENGVEYFR